MDDRKKIIRELEEKNWADSEARNRLLEGLGETLLLRIEGGQSFLLNVDEKPGMLVVEYRKQLKEIAEAMENIKSNEAAIEQIKELEAEISGKEEEYSRLEKRLSEVYLELGKELFVSLDSGSIAGASRQQEEALLEKINEQEIKLKELEDREGNIFHWLGKNAQMAVSKALLLKNKSALQRVYRATGEKYLSSGTDIDALLKNLDEEAAEAAGEALEIKGLLSSIIEGLSDLKHKHGKIGELYGTGNSPSRRIQGLEKLIVQTKAKLPGIYLRFGSLALDSAEGGIAALIGEEDYSVLEKVKFYKTNIANTELEIEKINAAIGIDNEKAEIERTKKAIISQQQKISAAEAAITGLEKQIAESKQRIMELELFLTSGTRSGQPDREDHGSKDEEKGNNGEGAKGHSGKSRKTKSPGRSGSKKSAG